ncbi:mannose-1-phosphate guanylyltransferase/mannose-6-phosphate isomerase [Roseibium sp. M-1]
MAQIIPTIMIGGSGTRLWPLSRKNSPKQFLRLFGEKSLFQETVARFPDSEFASPWLMTNVDVLNFAVEQSEEIGIKPAGIFVEPLMRGTAAAIAAMAVAAEQLDPQSLILAAPADHVIENPEEFRRQIQLAKPLAEDGAIITFGIVPTAPETGFGYIKGGKTVSTSSGDVGFRVSKGGFLEKPDLATAQGFLAAGTYYWNAGIFLFSAKTIIREMKTYAPGIMQAAGEAVAASQSELRSDIPVYYLNKESFAQAPEMSIDNAVMEHSDKIVVVPSDIGWSDVGSLSAIWDISPKDTDSNVTSGKVLTIDSHDCLLKATADRRIVALGIENIMIVDTVDSVLVMPRSRAQDVKQIVSELKAIGAREAVSMPVINHDWGDAEQKFTDEDHSVTQLKIRPGNVIPNRRVTAEREIWLVVKGTVDVIVNYQRLRRSKGETFTLKNNDTITVINPDEDKNAKCMMMVQENREFERIFEALKPAAVAAE